MTNSMAKAYFDEAELESINNFEQLRNDDILFLEHEAQTPTITLQTSTDIENLYNAGENDEKQLRALLSSWNLSCLFNFLKNQQIYVGVLKHFPDNELGVVVTKLFESTNFAFGIQMEFLYHLSQWKKSESAVGSAQKILPNNVTAATSQVKMLDALKTQKPSKINLHNILSEDSSPYGEAVKNYYKQHGHFDEKTRKLLVEAFLQYCISNNVGHVSKEDCKMLAEEIVKTFSGETLGYYYVHRPGAPLGKLYNKFHNWKSTKMMKSTKSTGEPLPKAPRLLFEAADSEQEYLRSLKFDNLSFEERLLKWQGCVATRLNSLSANEKPLAEAWPQYKEPIGYKLIESDFNFVYGVKSKFLDESAQFMDLMLSHVLPFNLKNSEDLNLLNQVKKNKNELSRNAICAAVFYLIQSLLPNGKSVILLKDASNIKKKKTQKYYSIKESREAFIVVCQTQTLYKEHYDAKVARDSSVPPYISIIGTLLAPTEIYVDFENITYKMVSLPRAIDICFKAYNLFKMKYSPAARLMWQFLNAQFYKLEDISPQPVVHVLVKQINDAEEELKESSNLQEEAVGQKE